ncbi:MAG TPA: hypothetical protein VGM30_17615 [Puia sp.]|jgi:hypothetical protein
MDYSSIRGLDLHIDDAIQEICKTSNATAGNTRSVLYVLMLVCILAIISVINSYDSYGLSNWTTSRIDRNSKNANNIFKELADTTTEKLSYHDSLAIWFNLDVTKKRLENNLRNEMENVHLVRIPVLGNSFDINDLGLVGGIAITILLVIAQFTLTREANNLKIALRAVTERYIDSANEEDFRTFLEKEEIRHDKNFDKTHTLASVNYTRRQHHYNFLSMNEIFNLPPLEVSEKKKQHTIAERLVGKIFGFPFVVYCLVVFNDAFSIADGWDMNKINTVFLLVAEIFFLIVIYSASAKCTRLKESINELYDGFKKNEYRYIV